MTKTHNRKKFTVEIHGKTWEFFDIEGSATGPFVAREILEYDHYGLEKVQLGPEDEVIDVGSNISTFSIAVYLKFGCRVVAFEPVYDLWLCGLMNQGLNGVPPGAIHSWNDAVMDKPGTVTVKTPPWATGNGGLYHPDMPGLMVQDASAVTLDAFISPKTKYIKIDAEGAEGLIIPKILPLIKHVPYLGIEAHRNSPHCTPDELRALIDKEYPGTVFWNVGG